MFQLTFLLKYGEQAQNPGFDLPSAELPSACHRLELDSTELVEVRPRVAQPNGGSSSSSFRGRIKRPRLFEQLQKKAPNGAFLIQ